MLTFRKAYLSGIRASFNSAFVPGISFKRQNLPLKLPQRLSSNQKGRPPFFLKASLFNKLDWCRLGDSNTRPTDYKSVALPAELNRQSQVPLFLECARKVNPLRRPWI